MSTEPRIDVGDTFPSFEIRDQTGELWTLDRLQGKRAVIYFYPKDDTPGCTVEACDFRDLSAQFAGAIVLGVSPDGMKSHERFAQKFSLNFPLLADEGHRLAEACGLWGEKTLYGRKYMGVDRTTYLLDGEGKIERVWRKVKPTGHAAEVAAALGQS
mgnify:CR=1 FL=1